MHNLRLNGSIKGDVVTFLCNSCTKPIDPYDNGSMNARLTKISPAGWLAWCARCYEEIGPGHGGRLVSAWDVRSVHRLTELDRYAEPRS